MNRDQGKKQGKKERKLPRLLLRLLGALITLVLLALAALALILSRPSSDDSPEPDPQPLLSGSPAVNVSAEAGIAELLSSFPAPVMSFMSGSGMTFVSGTSADTALDGGFGRIVTLRWLTPSGDPMTLESIYPASALSLLEGGDYHFSQIAGPALFGSASVRMENAESVRVHTATDTGLYAVTLPRRLSGELSELTRSLLLFTLDP